MSVIFKNYMKTFVKNWIQTIGTVLFILMMCAVVIGMLATPLQISAKLSHFSKDNNKFDTYIKANNKRISTNDLYTDDFVYEYMYENKPFTTTDPKTGQYKEILGRPSQLIGQQPVESIFSELAMASINANKPSNTNTKEWHAQVANTSVSAMQAFAAGALTPSGMTIKITDADQKGISANKSLIKNNLTQMIVTDKELYKNQGYTEGEAQVKAITKAYNFFSYNQMPFNILSIKDPSSLSKLMDDSLNTFDGKTANKEVTILSYQIYSPEMYKILADPLYGYNFQTYINYQVLHNISNPDAVNQQNQNSLKFALSTEQNYYFSKTTTESLFPTFSLELKNAGLTNEANQIQIESGNRPEAFTIKDIEKGKMPTIVLASGYMKHNNLNIGDVIEIPSTPEANVILSPDTAPSDAYFANGIKAKIVGSGQKYDDLVPGKKYIPYLEEISGYAIGYVDDSFFNAIRNARWGYATQNNKAYATTYRIKELTNTPIEKAFTISESKNTGVYDLSRTIFPTFKTSKTNQSLNNIKIQVIIYVVLGVVVLILAFIFINFSIKKELNETRKQLGVFKAFGYKNSELSWIFAVKTLVTIFVGIALGYLVSIPVQLYQAGNYVNGLMFSFAHIYAGAAFMVVIFIVVPLLFLLISYLLTLKYLNEPTLSLLSNGYKVSKTLKPSHFIRWLDKKDIWFNYRLQRSFVRTSMGKFITVQVLFAFASLTFSLMFGAQAIMYSTVDQGFSIINSKVDHNFYWSNPQDLNINYDETKYDFKNIDKYHEQDFQYIPYSSGDQSMSDVLNEDKKTSDSRFRVSYIIGGITNSFSNKATREKALDTVMIKNGYYDKWSSTPVNNAQMRQLGKVIYDDYYINWVLSFMINGENGLDTQTVQQVKDNHKFTLNDLEAYTKEHNSRLPIHDALFGKDKVTKDKAKAEIEANFVNTVFGMQDRDVNGLKNNLFMSDITKIITMELFENYVDGKVHDYLAKNFKPAITKNNSWDKTAKYRTTDIDKAVEYVKANDKIVKDFDPNNSKYWGIANNPLVDTSALMGDAAKKGDKDDSGVQSGGLSLSKLSQDTISLIMSAMMLGVNNPDINQNPTLTINELFYNQEKDFLQYQLPILGLDSNDDASSYVRLVDSQTTKYGDYFHAYDLNGVSENTFRELGNELDDPETINAIVPYGLAKARKLEVGDILESSTNTLQRQRLKLKVIGINKNITFQFLGGWPIDVDYDQYRQKFFSDEVNKTIDNGQPIFNNLTSQSPMLEGDINLNDLAGSINSLKFVGNNVALSIAPNSSVFGSIFNGMIDIQKLFNLNVDTNVRLLTNPNVASISMNSGVTPYNILRVGVNDATSRVNNILTLFMILEAILLLIILIVVMNIVVEEQAQVILTLRSLGYTKREINWIVMGSYITGALISFVIAYLLSLLIWWGVLELVASQWQIYIFMAFSWKAPVITFLVIGSILVIGWAIADYQVNKTPLTQVTSFG